MDVTLSQAFEFIGRASVGTLLIGVLFGGVRQWWVFGWTYRDLRDQNKELARDRDEWRNLALTGTRIAERTMTQRAKRGQVSEAK